MDVTDKPISLSEAFDKASSTLKITDTDKPAETVEPSSEPEADPKESETPESSEENPPKSEDTEDAKKELGKLDEADLESIDPKSIPPELKPTYDNLMKGFTKGRQKDSKLREEAIARAEEAEKKLQEYETKSKGAEFSELSPEELQRLTPAEQAQYFSALTDYKAQLAVKESKIGDYRTQALIDYESADPRLMRPTDAKPNEKYDRFMDSAIGAALDEELDQYARVNGSELGFPHKEKLAELIKEYDEAMKTRYGNFIKDQNEKLKDSEAKNNKLSPKTSPAKATPKKPSLGEALRMAQEKLGA